MTIDYEAFHLNKSILESEAAARLARSVGDLFGLPSNKALGGPLVIWSFTPSKREKPSKI